jgi:glycosyltransferase involved in cell wall biosynthesis
MSDKTYSNPFFSIAVTTYNRKDLLKQMLLSLLEQDFKDFEIIVGNDFIAEPLNLEMIGIEDERITIINNDQNLGELGNMNSLLSAAKGRYFTWQFDDDLCAPSFLSETKKALDQFDYPSCIFTSFTYIYDVSKSVCPRKNNNGICLYSGCDFLRQYLSGGLRVLGLEGFYNTEYLRNSGGAKRLSDSRMALYSEYLLIFKAGLLNKVAYINSQLIAYRVHNTSFSCNSNEVNSFKLAGINLIRESLPVFSTAGLKNDFNKNITSLLKSVISVVITKSIMAGMRIRRKDISDYSSLIKAELDLLDDQRLKEICLQSLNISIKHFPFFYLKAQLKRILSLRYLKFAHRAVSLISGFTNKSF